MYNQNIIYAATGQVQTCLFYAISLWFNVYKTSSEARFRVQSTATAEEDCLEPEQLEEYLQGCEVVIPAGVLVCVQTTDSLPFHSWHQQDGEVDTNVGWGCSLPWWPNRSQRIHVQQEENISLEEGLSVHSKGPGGDTCAVLNVTRSPSSVAERNNT